MHYTTEIWEQQASKLARSVLLLISSHSATRTVSYSYHPSCVRTTDTTLGVGDATRDCARQSWCAGKRPLGTAVGTCCFGFHPPGPVPATLALGACIESYTEVGGVFVRWRESTTLAVGVAVRLGYIVLARESGRGGEEAADEATAVVEAEVEIEAAVLVTQ